MRSLIKSIYNYIPFKTNIFPLLKKVWTPSENIYRHLHFKGVVTIPVDQQHSFKVMHYGYQVENDLFWAGVNGKWEKQSLSIWVKLCKHATVILDIGANTGVYSLIAKSINKDAEVYAFEPVKRVYNKLVFNNRLNGYNIKCIEKAASNANGKAVIYDNHLDHEYAASLSDTNNKDLSESSMQIETITLDSFIDAEKLSPINLMKIDVEHHEPQVLEGFQHYLHIYRPSILIEVLSDEVGARIQSLVEGVDYLFFNIDEESGINKVGTIKKSDGFNYLLCTKETARVLDLI